MYPSNTSHEAHRGGQLGNGFNRCGRYQDCHDNSFNGNANYRNGPYTGRFPAPFHGSTPRFRFGSWGCGRALSRRWPSVFPLHTAISREDSSSFMRSLWSSTVLLQTSAFPVSTPAFSAGMLSGRPRQIRLIAALQRLLGQHSDGALCIP
ncbi:hypothetical protein MTO96_029079 [Rhipicephalus appendiculatus]